MELEDVRYAEHLGLVKDLGGDVVYANRIYAHVIPRVFGDKLRYSLDRLWNLWLITPEQRDRLLRPDGDLNVDALLGTFVRLFIPVVGRIEQGSDDKNQRLLRATLVANEEALHVPLEISLGTAINGCGRVNLEAVVDRGAIDLLIEWPVPKNGGVKALVDAGRIKRLLGDMEHFDIRQHLIEVKYYRRRDQRSMTQLSHGIREASTYARQLNTEHVHFFVYDLMEEQFSLEALRKEGLEFEGTVATGQLSGQEGGIRCVVVDHGPRRGRQAPVRVSVRIHYMAREGPASGAGGRRQTVGKTKKEQTGRGGSRRGR